MEVLRLLFHTIKELNERFNELPAHLVPILNAGSIHTVAIHGTYLFQNHHDDNNNFDL
jgi:hypothetical protein